VLVSVVAPSDEGGATESEVEVEAEPDPVWEVPVPAADVAVPLTLGEESEPETTAVESVLVEGARDVVAGAVDETPPIVSELWPPDVEEPADVVSSVVVAVIAPLVSTVVVVLGVPETVVAELPSVAVDCTSVELVDVMDVLVVPLAVMAS
jgi:hypothetical protein